MAFHLTDDGQKLHPALPFVFVEDHLAHLPDLVVLLVFFVETLFFFFVSGSGHKNTSILVMEVFFAVNMNFIPPSCAIRL